MSLVAEGLRFGYGGHHVLDGVDVPAVCAGEVVAVVGPNAAGKSTLLKCLAGLETPDGSVRLDGAAPGAGSVLYVPQELPSSSSLTVFETVLLARRRGSGAGAGRGTREAVTGVEHALERLGLADLALAPLAQLSGGQRQLVGLAQALVRRPAVLLLDEPTSALDLRNQLHILEVIGELAREGPTAVLVTLHDLNLLGRVADRVLVMRSGTVHAHGPPAEVITEPLVREVYGVHAVITHHDDGGLGVAATGRVLDP